MHKSRAYKKFISIILIGFVTASGCKQPEQINVEAQNDKAKEEVVVKTSMLSEASIEYEVPSASPKILVDIVGYANNGTKQAIIEAPILPAVFYVIDASTNEEVFKGKVKKTKCAEDNEILTGICDFTEFEDVGDYYLKAEIVGVSKDFKITEDYFENHMKDTYKKILDFKCNCNDSSVILENNQDLKMDVSGGFHTEKSGKKDVTEGCLAVLDLLSSYEFNKKIYSDNCGIETSGNKIPDVIDIAVCEIDWLLKMQNEATGGVYSSVQRNEDNELVVVGETTNATALFCSAMAKSAIVLKNINPDISNKCNKAAAKAWKCLEINKALVPSEQMFRAATEMYRLTGYGVYHDVIKEYLKVIPDAEYDNKVILDGAISYIATPRSTQTEVCGELMTNFMSRTEDKAAKAAKSRYYVESAEMSSEELLRNAYELTIVDYAISSSEYTKLEKNYLHYLGGRNSNSIIYLDDYDMLSSYAELLGLTTMLVYKK